MDTAALIAMMAAPYAYHPERITVVSGLACNLCPLPTPDGALAIYGGYAVLARHAAIVLDALQLGKVVPEPIARAAAPLIAKMNGWKYPADRATIAALVTPFLPLHFDEYRDLENLSYPPADALYAPLGDRTDR